jgi:hypothetical protein
MMTWPKHVVNRKLQKVCVCDVNAAILCIYEFE